MISHCFAHAGAHEPGDLLHVLSQVDHLALVAAVVLIFAATVLVGRRWKRNR